MDETIPPDRSHRDRTEEKRGNGRKGHANADLGAARGVLLRQVDRSTGTVGDDVAVRVRVPVSARPCVHHPASPLAALRLLRDYTTSYSIRSRL